MSKSKGYRIHLRGTPTGQIIKTIEIDIRPLNKLKIHEWIPEKNT